LGRKSPRGLVVIPELAEQFRGEDFQTTTDHTDNTDRAVDKDQMDVGQLG